MPASQSAKIFEFVPLHTNKAVAIQKVKRRKASLKSLRAVEKGDLQGVIDALSEHQRRFCEEFLVDLNATQAVIRAGYKTKHPNRIAFQLLENPAVRVAIDALRAERQKNADVTKDYVLEGIQKAITKADEQNNLNAMLRGYELLARHLGMFVDRTEISGPDGEAIKYQKTREDAEEFINTLNNLRSRLTSATNDAA